MMLKWIHFLHESFSPLPTDPTSALTPESQNAMKKLLLALIKITLQVLLALGKIALKLFLFFVAVWVFMRIISIMDTRHMENGDKPHPGYMVAIFNVSDDSFSLGSLSQAAECSSRGDCYLIPRQKHGEVEIGEYSNLAYDLLEKTEHRSLIQTTVSDGDNTYWYTYSIDNNNVIAPIKTKMMHYAYMMLAIGMAIVCFLLFDRFGPALMAKLFGLLKRQIQSK
ncbi:MAG: hypothetical protein LBP52_04770 [Burkholderiaceae bacterium]|jgi:hypothetical protein|nr:hypothetical protein [Burkholderiaceae bacterium]